MRTREYSVEIDKSIRIDCHASSSNWEYIFRYACTHSPHAYEPRRDGAVTKKIWTHGTESRWLPGLRGRCLCSIVRAEKFVLRKQSWSRLSHCRRKKRSWSVSSCGFWRSGKSGGVMSESGGVRSHLPLAPPTGKDGIPSRSSQQISYILVWSLRLPARMLSHI
jgi:hypothetical protein